MFILSFWETSADANAEMKRLPEYLALWPLPLPLPPLTVGPSFRRISLSVLGGHKVPGTLWTLEQGE